MAIDLNALRAKHEELSNAGKGNANSDFLSKFVQLEEGTNAVRTFIVARSMENLVLFAMLITRFGRSLIRTKN